MALTDKHKRFADEYLIDLNATKAYLRAGYKCSEEAARRAASRLLTNVDVEKYISKRQQKVSEKAEISAEWVIQQLKENHELARRLGDIPPSNKALEMLGRHLGIFNDKLEVKGTLTYEKVLDEL